MILQYTQTTNIFDVISGPVWFLLGMLVILFIYMMSAVIRKLEEERERRPVVLIDLQSFTTHTLGRLVKMDSTFLPSEDGGLYKKVSIIVDTQRGERCVVSTYGDVSDLIMDNPGQYNLLIFAKLIGYSEQGSSVHEAFMKEAFPKSSFDYGKMPPLPNDYIIVQPSFNRGMLKAALSSSSLNLNNAYSFLNKYMLKNEQEYRKIYSNMSSMITDRLSFMNDIIISEYNSNLRLWDNTHKVRPSIMNILARCSHIELAKTGQTALTHILGNASIEVAGELISSLKSQALNLNDKFDLISIDKPTANILFNKISNQNQQLASATQQLHSIHDAIQNGNDEINA